MSTFSETTKQIKKPPWRASLLRTENYAQAPNGEPSFETKSLIVKTLWSSDRGTYFVNCPVPQTESYEQGLYFLETIKSNSASQWSVFPRNRNRRTCDQITDTWKKCVSSRWGKTKPWRLIYMDCVTLSVRILLLLLSWGVLGSKISTPP